MGIPLSQQIRPVRFFTSETHLFSLEMPARRGLKSSGARQKSEPSDVEIFRGFDDASARNAEEALKRANIPYKLTSSTEGSNNQFKMIEFHVAPKDQERAFQIVDNEINNDGMQMEDLE